MLKENQIYVKVGEARFVATLNDSAAAKELMAMLPRTWKMEELNGNEKYYFLPQKKFTVKETTPGQVKAGDLVLWQDNAVVLFYEGHRNTYAYTTLGAIDDPEGLAEAVGAGAVEIEFSR